MKSNVMFVIAMMAISAFAGISLIDFDEADAAEGDITVTYKIGDATIPVSTTGGKATLWGPKANDVDGDFEKFVVPQIPEGYKFTMWKNSAGNDMYEGGKEYTFVSSITLVPYYEVNGVLVTFVIGEEVYTKIVEDNGTIGTLPADVKNAAISSSDQKFIGWSYEGLSPEAALLSTADLELTKVGTADLIYTAEFTPIYEVTFIVNGVATKTLVGGETGAVWPANPEVPNYAFLGWTVDGKTIAAKDMDALKTMTFTADTTLTAVFEADIMEVVFMVDGKQYEQTKLVEFGKPIDAPAAPEKDGVIFDKWVIRTITPGVDGAEDTITDAVYDFNAPVKSDLILTAVFKEAEPEPEPEYKVVFTNAIGSANYGTYGIEEFKALSTLDAVAPAAEGQKFNGWMINDKVEADPIAYVKGLETVEADIVFVASYADADPVVVPEPGFFETTNGSIAAVLIAFVLVIFVAMVVTNYNGVKDKIVANIPRRIKQEEKKE